MPSLNNIFLIGPMGAGKTTIGRQIADLLGWQFCDTDQEIERRTGASIPWIFEKEGEDGFRRREEQVVSDLTALKHIVLATGGGVVMRPSNRLALQRNGQVVYLYTPVSLQVERTSHDRNRPLLHKVDPAIRLEELFLVRDPLYRQIADLVIPTTDGSARELANRIIQLLGGAAVK